MEKKRTILIWILICILLVFCVVIMGIILILTKNKEKKDVVTSNTIENIVTEENIVNIDNTNIIDSNESNDENEVDVVGNLTPMYNSRTYFLLQMCLNKYYSYSTGYDIEEGDENTDNNIDALWYFFDDEVKQKLNVNINNVGTFRTNKIYSEYCIDTIYMQPVANDIKLYLVYYREENDEKVKSTSILIKIDEKNQKFSIYPYQYLEKYNYTNLKSGDRIKIENVKEIKENGFNAYDSNIISTETLDYLYELYDRYQFDLLYDLEHLYNTLNAEYKKIHYNTFEEFSLFVEGYKGVLLNDKLVGYGSAKGENCVEFIGKGESGREYIFDIKNLMNYEIMLDSYTVETVKYQSAYNAALYQVRGKYCIDRIMVAINEKNYKFVYEKLNAAQKNNYYRNYEDFEKFILETFYAKNKYDIPGQERSISKTVYQYIVNVTNYYEEEESKTVNITVYLKEKGDFEIAIK